MCGLLQLTTDVFTILYCGDIKNNGGQGNNHKNNLLECPRMVSEKMNQSLEISWSTNNFDHILIVNGSKTNTNNYIQALREVEHDDDNFQDNTNDCLSYNRLTLHVNL